MINLPTTTGLPIASPSLPSRQKWDERYTSLPSKPRRGPTPFVQFCLPQLPGSGRALDVAAGSGRHSIALARHGLTVDALDISWEGLRLTRQFAAQAGLPPEQLRCLALDLERGWLPAQRYAVVLVSYFLWRPLLEVIKNRLLPGGRLVYETFTVAQLAQPHHRGSARPEFYLNPQELRAAFAGFDILFYAEGDHNGRCTAQLLAQKPGAGDD